MKLMIVFAGLITFSPASCKNDKTTEQLLTAKTWKADEIRVQLSDNTTVYYKRGSSGTLYDSDSLKFFANNTGVYYYNGMEYTTTWHFTNAEKTKMILVINDMPAITIHLENIQLTNTFFKYAQNSSAGGVSYLASGTRLPN